MRYLSISRTRLLIRQSIQKIKARVVPKSLLSRMLLIIIVPTITAQLISSYMFYKRHWDNVKKYMIYTLAGEIALISELHDTKTHQHTDKIDAYTFLQYTFSKEKTIQPQDTDLSKELMILKSHILYNIPNAKITIKENKRLELIEVQVKTPSGLFSFDISRNRIYTSSTHIFLLWMVGSTMTLLILTILFAKNQIRSITNLSLVADTFSKGGEVITFTPRGALEVKRAGQALLKMKEKIEKQVDQKAKMLAGVSHDLRTPLTRMKLELEIMPNNSHKSGLMEDVLQMENTINDYLEFAKRDDKAAKIQINLDHFFGEMKQFYSNTLDIKISCKGELYVLARRNQFKRALTNFLDNAQKYAKKVLIKAYANRKRVIIEIHDNGPGIPKSELKKVLEPFYRIDPSRNLDSGGVGLGMSISKGIIKNHNGKITLDRSPILNGLLIIIDLPKQ